MAGWWGSGRHLGLGLTGLIMDSALCICTDSIALSSSSRRCASSWALRITDTPGPCGSPDNLCPKEGGRSGGGSAERGRSGIDGGGKGWCRGSERKVQH